MKVIDVHIHLEHSAVDPGDITRFLEEGELSGMVLFSERSIGEGDKIRHKVEALAELRRLVGDCVYPFVRLDPTYKKAPEVLEWAVRDMGALGCKMLPQNFNPKDACACSVYEAAESLGIPLLMHTGILWIKGDSANNCRPGNMEVMWNYPKLRFAMAHIGWPWTDECLAVAQKMNILLPEADRAYIDLTPGTPDSYRPDAVMKCLELIGPRHMLYGSDATLPLEGREVKPMWKKDEALFNTLGLSEENKKKIFHDNALQFIGL